MSKLERCSVRRKWSVAFETFGWGLTLSDLGVKQAIQYPEFSPTPVAA